MGLKGAWLWVEPPGLYWVVVVVGLKVGLKEVELLGLRWGGLPGGGGGGVGRAGSCRRCTFASEDRLTSIPVRDSGVAEGG